MAWTTRCPLANQNTIAVFIILFLAERASSVLPVASDTCPVVVKHKTVVCPDVVLTTKRSVKSDEAVIRYMVFCSGDPPF